MNGLSELEQGKLIEAVESLEIQVTRLNTRIDSLEGQFKSGKGIIIGVFLTASGISAAIATSMGRFFG
jgi:chaperonin cofactor prefoldin